MGIFLALLFQSMVAIVGAGASAGTVATPTDSPGAGTYGSTQSVTLSSATGSAVICYTTNGTTPAATTPGTCSTGTTYSGAISVASTTTIKAIATKSGLSNSGVLTSAYMIAPTISILDHKATQSSDAVSASVSGMNCAGGNFVALWITSVTTMAGTGDISSTSSPGLTWHRVSTGAPGASTQGAWFYAYNASLSGSEDFTFTHTGFLSPSLWGVCASNVKSSADPLDQNGESWCNSGTTCQLGAAKTPSENGELVLFGAAHNAGTFTYSVDSGMTILNQFPTSLGGFAIPGATAYIVRTTATLVQPTWTVSGGTIADTPIQLVTFKAQ